MTAVPGVLEIDPDLGGGLVLEVRAASGRGAQHSRARPRDGVWPEL